MFSVVIPLYNKTRSILDTLESVFAQDFPHFEVVVVDDGSTDDGPAKVRRHFSDPRLRLIHQENGGESAARNSGIDAARFEWIALLDADDMWLPHFLSTVDEAIRRYPDAGMFCCGGVSRKPDGSGYVRRSKRFGTEPEEVRYFEAPYFFGNASATVFSKSLLSEVGYFTVGLRHYADAVFFFKLGLKTKVVFCPPLLSIYNIDLPGQVTSDVRSSVAGVVASSNLIYEFWQSLEPAERNPTCVSALLQDLQEGICYSLRHGDIELTNLFFESTDPSLLQRLPHVEKFLYQRRLKWASLLHRRLSRLRRRIRRQPSAAYCGDVMNAVARSAEEVSRERTGDR